MGFETVVRPVVFPNIRPAAARALRIEDAPDKGIATISGSGGAKIIDLPYSYSGSWSKSQQVEKRRTFDMVRVYASKGEDNDNIDKKTYVDFEVATAINYKDTGQETTKTQYAKPQASKSVKILASGQTRSNPDA